MNTYIAVYLDKQIEVHANTTFEAQIRAKGMFDVKDGVSVRLIDKSAAVIRV